ncbi:hypothetical protein DZF91_01845 [Actinomadura logoneensis]|uniref:Uncharacterized protein n=1 Tax=Actinomadura logoneensis TaxID=2293572 RepID=A0A372JTE6_9ACTN|nr:hypothetical protein DZF91_01845 [Actinomadura logoneensis]
MEAFQALGVDQALISYRRPAVSRATEAAGAVERGLARAMVQTQTGPDSAAVMVPNSRRIPPRRQVRMEADQAEARRMDLRMEISQVPRLVRAVDEAPATSRRAAARDTTRRDEGSSRPETLRSAKDRVAEAPSWTFPVAVVRAVDSSRRKAWGQEDG